MRIEAFEGRVVFVIHHLSPLRRVQWQKNEDALKDHPDHQDDILSLFLSNFDIALALTDDIEFHFRGDEGQPLHALKEWWEKRTDNVVAMWEAYKDAVTAETNNTWKNSCTTASLVVIDPATAPLWALTAEQRTEAEKPNSPLVLPASKMKKSG